MYKLINYKLCEVYSIVKSDEFIVSAKYILLKLDLFFFNSKFVFLQIHLFSKIFLLSIFYFHQNKFYCDIKKLIIKKLIDYFVSSSISY